MGVGLRGRVRVRFSECLSALSAINTMDYKQKLQLAGYRQALTAMIRTQSAQQGRRRRQLSNKMYPGGTTLRSYDTLPYLSLIHI